MMTLFTAVLIAAAAPSLATPAPSAPGASVTIELAGVKAGSGDLYVSLQTRDQFMKPTGSYGTIVARPAPGARSIVLPGVAPGRYSVAVWHDNNGNRSFDRRPSGEPIDGWAMINGDTMRAAPAFDKVSFTVDGKDQAIKLDMRYGG